MSEKGEGPALALVFGPKPKGAQKAPGGSDDFDEVAGEAFPEIRGNKEKLARLRELIRLA